VVQNPKTGGGTGTNQYGMVGNAKAKNPVLLPTNVQPTTDLLTVPDSNQGLPISARPVWNLAPSDFSFLHRECPQCFYLKVAKGQRRPGSPFPSVFNKIDKTMKEHYTGQRAELAVPGLPPGVLGGSASVKSKPLILPGASQPLQIKGQLDATIQCDDDTLAILDFKTSTPSAYHTTTYSNSLHAYALAVENPAEGPASIVSQLGLVVFSPTSFSGEGLKGDIEYIPIKYEREKFLDYLGNLASTLSAPNPPSSSPKCEFCKWKRSH
jgi:hypothetical protein